MSTLLDEAPAARTDPLETLVAQLREVRLAWREAQGRTREPAARELPSPDTLAHVLEDLGGVLFPMRLGPPELRAATEDRYVRQTLGQTLLFLEGLVRLELQHDARLRGQELSEGPGIAEQAHRTVQAFAATLPTVRAELDADLAASFAHEPDARSQDELLLWHRGLRALRIHRLAHRWHQAGLPLLARMAADRAHRQTGIDIHPGARLGAGCALRRATGLVIPDGAVVPAGTLIDGPQAVGG